MCVPVRETLHLEGKELEFKVIKLDQKRNNVVVSRRAVMEAANSVERDALLETLQEGMSVKGIVKNLTDYGAFVDLGGVDGLLHITDMAWKRIKHPSEIVEVGQEIEVKILKFDRERNRVSLGLKQLGEDPWVEITESLPGEQPGQGPHHQPHRLRLLSPSWKRAWRAWCTCPRWTGPTRTFTPPRSSSWATRWR